MATSSITHNFVISDPAAIERFVQAIDESEKEKAARQEKHSHNWKLLTDPQEIRELTERCLARLKENENAGKISDE